MRKTNPPECPRMTGNIRFCPVDPKCAERTQRGRTFSDIRSTARNGTLWLGVARSSKRICETNPSRQNEPNRSQCETALANWKCGFRPFRYMRRLRNEPNARGPTESQAHQDPLSVIPRGEDFEALAGVFKFFAVLGGALHARGGDEKVNQRDAQRRQHDHHAAQAEAEVPSAAEELGEQSGKIKQPERADVDRKEQD